MDLKNIKSGIFIGNYIFPHLLKGLIISLAIINTGFSQEIEKTYLIGEQVINSKDEIDSENFSNEVLELILFDQINQLLESKGIEKKLQDSLLKRAAASQAAYMALKGDDVLLREEKNLATTGQRIAHFGGSTFGEELVGKTSVKKGNIPFTYAKIADDLIFRWVSVSKKLELIENVAFNRIGVGVALDNAHKKVYVSLVFGNYKSLNNGVAYRTQLAIPYSTKTYGLQPTDKDICKKVLKQENLNDLQKCLHVEDQLIYFETDNVTSLKKIIRKKKDGLAVDILQQSQFGCQAPNILDHSQINSGILTKRIYSNKLFKNNIANTQENPKAFKAELGMLPNGLSDGYELNLVVIQNKTACANIAQSFVIPTSGTYTRNIKLLADTVTINSKFNYKPIADSMELSFKIPFENKKFTYQTADIEPFLKLLNEPAFLIYDLKITAYSSIEGTDKENRMLQQKRAESIVSALKDRQGKIIHSEILTDYNWTDFTADIKNTQHNILASMQLEEAQAYIRTYGLNKELEPILQNHRYARIDMKVTYDISGENEQPFVLKKFNNAVADDDRILALSIQKYIIKQILSYRYKPELLAQMSIPSDKDWAGLEMNRQWAQVFTHQISDEEFAVKVETLCKLNPENEYIAYNDIYNKITLIPITDLSETEIVQNRIDRLYYTPLKKETVDGLNIKFQFKLINYYDSVGGDQKLKLASVERIKQIIDIKEESLSNSMRLAELFIDNKDYRFAIKTLEPWVIHPNHNEELIFAYVSLCSQFEEQMHTNTFELAIKRAQELNPSRFCELFNGQNFSLKVFENQLVKQLNCKYCQTENSVALDSQ